MGGGTVSRSESRREGGNAGSGNGSESDRGDGTGNGITCVNDSRIGRVVVAEG